MSSPYDRDRLRDIIEEKCPHLSDAFEQLDLKQFEGRDPDIYTGKEKLRRDARKPKKVEAMFAKLDKYEGEGESSDSLYKAKYDKIIDKEIRGRCKGSRGYEVDHKLSLAESMKLLPGGVRTKMVNHDDNLDALQWKDNLKKSTATTLGMEFRREEFASSSGFGSDSD
ncbi:MAG: hypothetical protein CL728_04890 [Chloroflexi bacterium]|nr:hypothetical protein [Chloroflexota bacterium]